MLQTQSDRWGMRPRKAQANLVVLLQSLWTNIPCSSPNVVGQESFGHSVTEVVLVTLFKGQSP